jgi:hypothetical protein
LVRQLCLPDEKKSDKENATKPLLNRGICPRDLPPAGLLETQKTTLEAVVSLD